MKFPEELKIKESEAELGTVTGQGYIKSIIGKFHGKHDMSDGELLALLNDHKPVIIARKKDFERGSIERLEKIVKDPTYPASHKEEVMEHIRYKNILHDYLGKIKLYYIDMQTEKFDTVIVWKNKREEKRAFLLKLFYYRGRESKELLKDFEKEERIFRKSVHITPHIKQFFFHYVTGTLLGYRASSIRGYCISPSIYTYLTDMFDYDDRKEFQKTDVKLVKKQYKEAREEYMKTGMYSDFKKDYPKLKKAADKWIDYMLNDSSMFEEYYKQEKKNVKTL